jgi:hypothetical protein
MAVTASPLSQFCGNGPAYTNRPRLRAITPRAGAGTVIKAALSTTSTLTAMRPTIPIASRIPLGKTNRPTSSIVMVAFMAIRYQFPSPMARANEV